MKMPLIRHVKRNHLTNASNHPVISILAAFSEF